MPMAARAMISNWLLINLAVWEMGRGTTPVLLIMVNKKNPMINQGTLQDTLVFFPAFSLLDAAFANRGSYSLVFILEKVRAPLNRKDCCGTYPILSRNALSV